MPCSKSHTTGNTGIRNEVARDRKYLKRYMEMSDHVEKQPTTSKVKQHKEFKHEGIRYQCDQCKYAATTTSELKIHKESKHEGIRYPCDQCGYHAATQLRYLKKHKESKH